jgi:hypothetical protein
MHERLMELALVRAVPDQHIEHMRPCRLRGLYERLIKAVDRDLARMPRPTDADIIKIGRRIERFGMDTGWLNETRHTGTLMSFCADMIERSTFDHNPRILETINEIILHMENGGDLKTSCCWAGSVAADKWMDIKKEA